MKSALLFLVLVVSLSGSSFAQDGSIGCFVPGECLGSPFADITETDTPDQCLDFCQNTDGCLYFTHYADSAGCFAFLSCDDFSSITCDDCVSGDADCDSNTGECDQPGRCLGTTAGDGLVETDSQADCTEVCEVTPGCNWASWDSSDGFCTLTEDCDQIDDCDTCTHSPIFCEDNGGGDVTGFTKLYVIGGEDETSPVFGTEVVDLSGNNAGCVGVPYPYTNDFPVAMLNPEEVPIACGGEVAGDECLILDPDLNSWLPGPSMAQERRDHIAIKRDTDSYWIIEGAADPASENYVNGAFSVGPDLGINYDWPCGVAIDADNVFVSGGRAFEGDLRSAFVYDFSTGVITDLPDMSVTRMGHTCGLAVKSDGTRHIVVAGGISSGNAPETEIWDLDGGSNSWRPGPTLSRETVFSVSVQFGDSFLTVGGSEPGQGVIYDEIFEWDPDAEAWIQRTERLQAPRYAFGSVLVSDDVAGC